MYLYSPSLERSQATFRLSFVAVFLVYLAGARYFDKTPNGVLSYWILAGYLFFSGSMVAISHRAQAASTSRLNACVVLDQIFIAALYVGFGEIGAPVLLCPALASVGYAVRYGPAFAYKCAAAGLVFLVPAMAISDYWSTVPLTAAGMIVSNCCLPVYAAAISQRIRRDNRSMRRRASDLLLAKQAVETQLRHDPLTGLLNRAGLDAVIDSAIGRSGRCDLCAVAAMDLDGFKKINDTYGHQVGDELLVEVGKLIRAHIPGAAARYGGDEFIFAVGAAVAWPDVISSFEHLRTSIAALEVAPGARVSTSVGVYAVSPERPANRADLLEAADKLMYLAKRRGRDQIQTSFATSDHLTARATADSFVQAPQRG